MSKLANMADAMSPLYKRLKNASRFHTTKIFIQCTECKRRREVFKQDMHQVKRCVDCQRKMRNARPKLNKGASQHAKRVKRGQKGRYRRKEPIIPRFTDRPQSKANNQELVI